MNVQEIRELQEAYIGVYIQEEVDLWVSDIIEEGYNIDEYTDEELLEAFLDERKNEDPKGVANKAGVNKPDAWGAPTKFGQEATRNSLAAGMKGVRTLQRAGVRINRHHRNKFLAHKVHQGWSKSAKESEHQTPEQKDRRSKLIKPDLATFRRDLPKPERDKDVPFVKKAERAVSKKGEFAESYDPYDIILSHLLDEGYAETTEAAEKIMVNMSEEWRDDIIDEANRGDEYATRGMSPEDAKTWKSERRNSTRGFSSDVEQKNKSDQEYKRKYGKLPAPDPNYKGSGQSKRQSDTRNNRGKRTTLVHTTSDTLSPSGIRGTVTKPEIRTGTPLGGTKNPEPKGKYLRQQQIKDAQSSDPKKRSRAPQNDLYHMN